MTAAWDRAGFGGLDLLVLALLLYGLVGGLRRGLSGELARAVGTAVVLFCGWRFHRPLGAWLLERTRTTAGGADALAFGLLFAAALVAMLLLRGVLRRLFAVASRGWVEHLGGATAGLLRGAILAALALLALGLVPYEPANRLAVEQSAFGRVLYAHLPSLYGGLARRYDLPALPEPLREEERPDEPQPSARANVAREKPPP